MKKKSIYYALFFILFTQFVFPQQQSLNRDDSSPNEIIDRRDTTQIFLARGGSSSVDWGLALSGGGVRSAAFSIGAMKALFDIKTSDNSNILDEIDVISSVSGGSYASYWLYSQYDPFSNQKFGNSAFENNKYIKNICYLQNIDKSKTLPNKSLLKIIFNFNKNAALSKYEDALVKTFGSKLTKGAALNGFLDSNIKAADAPYFIINTTAQVSDSDFELKKYKKEERQIWKRMKSVFELTPEFRGNPAMKFHDWEETGEDSLTLSRSIAMSGAPKWKLESSIKNPNQAAIKGKTLRLSDGGHSENLAALALLRRGVKNIIIIDAEQDPTYEFDAYRKLKEVLILLGMTIERNKIDEYRDNPQAKCFDYDLDNGKTKNICSPPALSKFDVLKKNDNSVVSTIYYVKMSRPESIYKTRFSDTTADKKGEELSTIRSQDRCELEICDCEKIKSNFIKENKDLESLYTYEVKEYSNLINHPSKDATSLWFRSKLKIFNTIGKISPFFSYKFPHTTTVDQSFFSNQLEAFVGLGYLQTLEIENELKK